MDSQDNSTWIVDNNTLRCPKCGFGYFPTDYFFKNGVCLHTKGVFVFKYCPMCNSQNSVSEEYKKSTIINTMWNKE